MTPERMQELFVGRADDFAIQQPDGRYQRAGRPLTLIEYAHHLDGDFTIGVYFVRPDGTCRLGCIDLDEDRRDYLEALWASAIELRVPESAMLREFSGRKGYHLWFFFADWTPAVTVRRLLSAVILSSGVPLTRVNEKGRTLPLIETYPKQDELSKTDKGFGNLVKLPLGIHRASGKLGEPLEITGPIDPLRPDEVLALVAPLPEVSPPKPEKVAVNGAGVKREPYPCTAPMMAATWSEGGRNTVLFHIAKRLNVAGYSEDETVAQLMPWQETHFDEPLSKTEARRTIRSGMHYTSMGCLDPLVMPHCVVTCPIYVREHPATIANGPRLQVSTSDPPEYRLPLSVGMLKVTHEELLDWELIRKAALAQLHVFLPRRQSRDWDRELEPLVRNVEKTAAPPEVSPDGVILTLIKQWLERAMDDPVHITRRGVFHDVELGVYAFAGADLIRYVQQTERNIERRRVWYVVRQIGGYRQQRTIGGQVIDVWEIPDEKAGR